MDWDRNGFLKPYGPRDWIDRPSGRFSETCPFSPSAANEDEIASELYPAATHQHDSVGRYEAAFVGAAEEEGFRPNGSSGGLTTWVAAQLLRSGRVDGVAHVSPTDPTETGRFFEYRISRTIEDLRSGAKSRYYPIELSRVLREIRATPGRYAIVGIPCFIKAIRLLQRRDPLLRERISYTLGLFCGHMKSAAMVESFAWQMGRDQTDVRAIDYRTKDANRPANWYRARLELEDGSSVEKDWWDLADGDWGAGFFQSSACDWCDDVVAETADVSFGDAWVEPFSSDGRGTNVVIARSPELRALLEEGRGTKAVSLEPVDSAFLVETQAAGLRHRREGLAYRLSWRSGRSSPRKRVHPSADLKLRRRLVYCLRYAIGRSSHILFRAARWSGYWSIYLKWARLALKVYRPIAWPRPPKV